MPGVSPQTKASSQPLAGVDSQPVRDLEKAKHGSEDRDGSWETSENKGESWGLAEAAEVGRDAKEGEDKSLCVVGKHSDKGRLR